MRSGSDPNLCHLLFGKFTCKNVKSVREIFAKSNVNRSPGQLAHDFMNFNALKTILKIHKKIIKKDQGLILTQGYLLVA